MPSGVVKTQKQWEALLSFISKHRIYYRADVSECACLDSDEWHRAVFIEALATTGRLTYKLEAMHCRYGVCGQLTVFGHYSVLSVVNIVVRK